MYTIYYNIDICPTISSDKKNLLLLLYSHHNNEQCVQVAEMQIKTKQEFKYHIIMLNKIKLYTNEKINLEFTLTMKQKIMIRYCSKKLPKLRNYREKEKK